MHIVLCLAMMIEVKVQLYQLLPFLFSATSLVFSLSQYQHFPGNFQNRVHSWLSLTMSSSASWRVRSHLTFAHSPPISTIAVPEFNPIKLYIAFKAIGTTVGPVWSFELHTQNPNTIVPAHLYIQCAYIQYFFFFKSFVLLSSTIYILQLRSRQIHILAFSLLPTNSEYRLSRTNHLLVLLSKITESLPACHENFMTISPNDLPVSEIMYFFRQIVQCLFIEDAMVNTALY